jgi:3-hydroxyisobutyrate dehydrogenase-like beta-hydroxyacid dehydrogenase
MNVGFIGLGLMGRPMALNLIRAGHSLRVWARRAEAMQPLLDAGATAAVSAADVAANVDVVITIVGDAPDVERVALGPDGIADGARPGLIHIDMSTISPEVTQSIARRLAARGVTMLDAPVSGGEPGAINAALTIMVGGDASAFECVKPLFEAMGKTISHIGGNGAGQAWAWRQWPRRSTSRARVASMPARCARCCWAVSPPRAFSTRTADA